MFLEIYKLYRGTKELLNQPCPQGAWSNPTCPMDRWSGSLNAAKLRRQYVRGNGKLLLAAIWNGLDVTARFWSINSFLILPGSVHKNTLKKTLFCGDIFPSRLDFIWTGTFSIMSMLKCFSRFFSHHRHVISILPRFFNPPWHKI